MADVGQIKRPTKSAKKKLESPPSARPARIGSKLGRQNVFLVGLMAVGKSTVGRLLAQQLGYDFYDTDQVIEERAGADIAWIFDVEGEQGFRDRETHVLGRAFAARRGGRCHRRRGRAA